MFGGSSADSLVGQYQCLESNAGDYWEPVEVTEEGGYMGEFQLNTRHAAAFWMRCKGLIAEAGSSQERVAVVEASDDEGLDQDLCRFMCEKGLNPANVIESKSNARPQKCDDFITKYPIILLIPPQGVESHCPGIDGKESRNLS